MVKTSTFRYSLHSLGSKMADNTLLERLDLPLEVEFSDIFRKLDTISFDVDHKVIDRILAYAAQTK